MNKFDISEFARCGGKYSILADTCTGDVPATPKSGVLRFDLLLHVDPMLFLCDQGRGEWTMLEHSPRAQIQRAGYNGQAQHNVSAARPMGGVCFLCRSTALACAAAPVDAALRKVELCFITQLRSCSNRSSSLPFSRETSSYYTLSVPGSQARSLSPSQTYLSCQPQHASH